MFFGFLFGFAKNKKKKLHSLGKQKAIKPTQSESKTYIVNIPKITGGGGGGGNL